MRTPARAAVNPLVLSGTLLLPLALLAVLRLVPAWDIGLIALWAHFQIVSLTSLIALVVAILIGSLAAPVADARTLLVTLAFAGIASVFLIHGVATPGVLFTVNPHAGHVTPDAASSAELSDEYESPKSSAPAAASPSPPRLAVDPTLAVTWSAPISLMVGAILLALAAIPWPTPLQLKLLSQRRRLWQVGLIVYILYILMAFLAPAPLAALAELSPSSLYILAALAMLLYAGVGIYFWTVYRREGRPLEGALAMACGFLAEAVFSMATMPLWHLSWWLYHLLMLIGFVFATGAVVAEYEQVRHFELTRYFAATSVIAVALLALLGGDLAAQLLGPLVSPDELNVVRWGTSGLFVGMSALLFIVLLLVVRRGDQLLIERTTTLQKQQVALERGRVAEALIPIGLAMGVTLDLDRVLDTICEESMRLFDVDLALLWLREGDELVGHAARGHKREKFIGMRQSLSDPKLVGARVVRERKPIFVNHARTSNQASQPLVSLFDIRSILGVPFLSDDAAVGALILIDTQNDERFTPLDVEVATIFGQQGAMALTRARLYATVKRQVAELVTLLSVSTTMRQATDLESVMETLLKQLSSTLGVVGGAIHLLDPEREEVRLTLAVGVLAPMQGLRLPLAGSLASQVLETLQPDLSLNLPQDGRFPPTLRDTLGGGACGLTLPMRPGGNPIGVLSLVFNHPPSEDELRLAQTITEIGGIAIHRVSLHKKTELQAEALAEALSDLRQSYQATLSALSAALDARDRETEGHSKRVTAYALVLADALGVTDPVIHQALELGALLHDIGKIGVPDAILLKPGPLNPTEWQAMRRHPEIGRQILLDISFLQPALAVVQFHHERWSGSGYPYGLDGENIPLPARIFAIADTLDAITNTRPYRIGRSFTEAAAEIRRQRDTQFDPAVVDAFLTIPLSTWERVKQEISRAAAPAAEVAPTVV
ncbi:MAG: GAF domain-containing protein [Chloroflexi bacterium]|nr:GAF domain-containing protein [Chloroflexota bacterium]